MVDHRKWNPVPQAKIVKQRLAESASGELDAVAALHINEMFRSIPNNSTDRQIVLWDQQIWNRLSKIIAVGDLVGQKFNGVKIPGQGFMWVLKSPPKYQDPEDDSVIFVGCIVMPCGDEGFLAHSILLNGKGEALIALYGGMERGDIVERPDAQIMGRLLFLNEEVESLREEHIPRTIRRQHQRRHREPPSVKTIVLRKLSPPSEVGDGPNEWSCHWKVREHKRRQWYPSTGEHREIIVKEYEKGDKTKPFKEPTPTIYLAKR